MKDPRWLNTSVWTRPFASGASGRSVGRQAEQSELVRWNFWKRWLDALKFPCC